MSQSQDVLHSEVSLYYVTSAHCALWDGTSSHALYMYSVHVYL